MIRKADVSDSASICKISSEDLGYECQIELVHLRMENLDASREVVFVEEDNNKVVGYVHVEKYNLLYFETMGNVLGLAVTEEYRRKGVGSRLMNAVEQWAKDNSIHFIRLNSGITRIGAHIFYKSLGFEEEKEQKRFIKKV